MLRTFDTYAIIQASDLASIDFDQIGETSENTLDAISYDASAAEAL